MILKIEQTLKEAVAGSLKVAVTFKKEADLAAIACLLGMDRNGLISISSDSRMILWGMMQSDNRWGDGKDSNRRVEFSIIKINCFDTDIEWLKEELEPSLEMIEVISGK